MPTFALPALFFTATLQIAVLLETRHQCRINRRSAVQIVVLRMRIVVLRVFADQSRGLVAESARNR